MMDELVRKRGGGRGQLQKKNKPDFCWDVVRGNAGQQNMWSLGPERNCKSYPNMALFSKAGSNSALYLESGGSSRHRFIAAREPDVTTNSFANIEIT